MVKKKRSLARTLKKAGVKKCKKRTLPLWRGPEVDGITQSLLSRFLVCKERFRLLVLEGLKPTEGFNHRIEYGNLWHLCEEKHAAGTDWKPCLLKCVKELCKRWPLHQEEVAKWYNVCKIQFLIYLDYWSKHKSRRKQTQILQEQTFCIPYKLPSGRTVLLRGMWDGVVTIGSGRNKKLWLKEHKTKGDIKPEQIERQLTFDLQTMLYLVALQEYRSDIPIGGVLYNVVRRPLSGGKGTIRQHKPTKSNPKGESKEEYYCRLKGVIEENASEFFMRWEVGITQEDIDCFKNEFLNPCLESLCDWWRCIYIISTPFSVYNRSHYRTPYGIYNVLAEGGSTELDAYLLNGNEVGLQRTEDLFPELSKES